MEIKDTITVPGLYGQVTYKIFNKDGKVIETNTTHNNIVEGIRLPIITLLSGKVETTKDNLPFVSYIQLGDGEEAPKSTDTDVQHVIPGSKKETFGPIEINTSGPSATFPFLYDAIDENIDGKPIHEMGLYTKDGTMIARTTVGTWQKISGLYFEIYWTIGYQS